MMSTMRPGKLQVIEEHGEGVPCFHFPQRLQSQGVNIVSLLQGSEGELAGGPGTGGLGFFPSPSAHRSAWTHSPVSTSLALAESLSLFRAIKREVTVKKKEIPEQNRRCTAP